MATLTACANSAENRRAMAEAVVLRKPVSTPENKAAPPNGPAVREATARLFRTVLAGQAWLRAAGAPINGPPPGARCVAMKPGADGPPVFMIPGAPGSILQLGALAAALSVPGPVYAIKPHGLEEPEIPYRSIPEMARHAIDVVKAVRATGPYLLVGYSSGGLVALEMARQLDIAGDAVPLVVLLDTYPSRRLWPLMCHAEIVARQTIISVWALRRCRPLRLTGEILAHCRRLFGYLAESGVKWLPAPTVPPEGTTAAARRVNIASVEAGEAYRPVRYSGKVLFVQPAAAARLEPRDPTRVWRKFLPNLAVRCVPGTHVGFLEGGATTTAATVSESLVEAML